MDRAARLAPWLDALAEYVEMPERPSFDTIDHALASGVVWLCWTKLPASDQARPAAFFKAYEALELLALLAAADYGAWLRVVKKVWPHVATFWADVFYPDKFQLGVHVHVRQGSELSEWAERAFCSHLVLIPLHSDYNSVRDELEILARRDGVDVEVEILVEVMPEDGAPNHEGSFSLLLFETVQLVRAQAARCAASDAACSGRSLFRLVKVWVESFHSFLTWKDIHYVEEICGCGVTVPVLFLEAMDHVRRLPPQHMVTTLQRLIVAPKKTGCAPIRGVCVDALSRHATLDAICSSLIYSTTVREVLVEEYSDVEDHQGGRARLIYWLALCVLGGSGCPSIEYLKLETTTLQQEDIQVLERTLIQGDALFHLFGGSASCIVAKASKFVLENPLASTSFSEASTIDLEDPLENLRVLSTGKEWISVLLPGWGQAWCRRPEVSLGERIEERSVLQTNCRPLYHLDIIGTNEPVVLPLLRLVGGDLDTLTIDGTEGLQPLTHTGVRAVCLVCPHLDDLGLEGIGVESLDVLGKCYAEGLCHASRLTLDIVRGAVNAADPLEFFRWLSIENHALSKHLRELHLKLHVPQLSGQLAYLLVCATMMLKRNKLMSNLSISIEPHDDAHRKLAHQTLDDVIAGFTSEDRQPVAVRVAPLRLEKKLAFLSCLEDSQLTSTRSARHELDATVVGLIFEFAAECKMRRVRVTIERDE